MLVVWSNHKLKGLLCSVSGDTNSKWCSVGGGAKLVTMLKSMSELKLKLLSMSKLLAKSMIMTKSSL